MDHYQTFKSECSAEVIAMGENAELLSVTKDWIEAATKAKYTYHFEWLGRPIIQLPQDMIALQEIVWETKPTIIIETGIAHGGSLILSASLLALLDLVDLEKGILTENTRKVIGIDVDIRAHNRVAIENHPLASRIQLIQASSTDPSLISQIKGLIRPNDKVMVILDSDHTEEHVLSELRSYSDLVSPGCYLIVFDTIVEFLDSKTFSNRDWGVGNNPWTATQIFLESDSRFRNNLQIENKLQLTVAPGGFLQRIS